MNAGVLRGHDPWPAPRSISSARSTRHKADLKFQLRSPILRIKREFAAKPSMRGTNNRVKIMAVAAGGDALRRALPDGLPRAARRPRSIDPEELTSTRSAWSRSSGSSPPAAARSGRSSGLFSRPRRVPRWRRLDQFVQATGPPRRPLLRPRRLGTAIAAASSSPAASAPGTGADLAASLAERCVNAGLRTLLVDGDLRSPTLSRMLDVPNTRGLISVPCGAVRLPDGSDLRSSAGPAGSLMPAGTPEFKAVALLRRLGWASSCAQAREGFDIVVVDAPPVPARARRPDHQPVDPGDVAGRRCDTSQFSLPSKKANRRLASVGVPVIGAVVNGVRIPDSTYGSYYPSYAYTGIAIGALDVQAAPATAEATDRLPAATPSPYNESGRGAGPRGSKRIVDETQAIAAGSGRSEDRQVRPSNARGRADRGHLLGVLPQPLLPRPLLEGPELLARLARPAGQHIHLPARARTCRTWSSGTAGRDAGNSSCWPSGTCSTSGTKASGCRATTGPAWSSPRRPGRRRLGPVPLGPAGPGLPDLHAPALPPSIDDMLAARCWRVATLGSYELLVTHKAAGRDPGNVILIHSQRVEVAEACRELSMLLAFGGPDHGDGHPRPAADLGVGSSWSRHRPRSQLAGAASHPESRSRRSPTAITTARSRKCTTTPGSR